MKFRFDSKTEKLIVSESSKIEYNQVKIWLERFVKGYKFTPAFKSHIWSGKESYFGDGKINMGLWKECFNALKEIDAKFEIENKSEFPINKDVTLEKVEEFCKEFFKDHKVKKDGQWVPFFPHDYQIESAFSILRQMYSISSIATSGGKSLVISIVYFYTIRNIDPDAKMLLIVPSISLVGQFYENILEYYYGQDKINDSFDYYIEIEREDGEVIKLNPNDDINTKKKGIIKGKDLKESYDNFKSFKKVKIEKDIRITEIMSDKPRESDDNPNIYIGCYQSLEKYPKTWFHQFHTVVVDEAHSAKSTTIKSILKRTFGHAKMRYGVSGTFPSDDSCEILLIQSLLGPEITKIKASDLIKKGNITPVEINCLLLNHNEPELMKKLKSAKSINNGNVIYNYEKKFFQESEKRINFIIKLVKTKCKNNTMILFHTIEHGKKIYDKLKEIEEIDVYFIDGEVSNKDRNSIIEEMNKTDRVKILVSSYGTTGTGLSINSIFNIIFADSFKSESLVIQAIGRALRKFIGKNTSTIYDLVDIFDSNDTYNIMYKQFLERESLYKKNEYPYKIIKINL